MIATIVALLLTLLVVTGTSGEEEYPIEYAVVWWVNCSALVLDLECGWVEKSFPSLEEALEFINKAWRSEPFAYGTFVAGYEPKLYRRQRIPVTQRDHRRHYSQPKVEVYHTYEAK